VAASDPVQFRISGNVAESRHSKNLAITYMWIILKRGSEV